MEDFEQKGKVKSKGCVTLSAMKPSVPANKDEHVFVIFGLPFKPNCRSVCGNTAWKPVKDLLRTLLRNELQGQSGAARDEPRVNIHDIPNGYFDPYATASFKEEEHAKTMFGLLAGNSWHGSILSVFWFRIRPNHSQQLVAAPHYPPDPIPLEKISPIRDSRLLRRQSPHTSYGSSSGRRASIPRLNQDVLHPPSGPSAMRNNSVSGPHHITGVVSGPFPPAAVHPPASCTVSPPYSCGQAAFFPLKPQQQMQIHQAVNQHAFGGDGQYCTAYLSTTATPYANFLPNLANAAVQQSSLVAVANYPAPAMTMQPLARALPEPQGSTMRARSTPGLVGPRGKASQRRTNKAPPEPATSQGSRRGKESGPVIANGSGDSLA